MNARVYLLIALCRLKFTRENAVINVTALFMALVNLEEKHILKVNLITVT